MKTLVKKLDCYVPLVRLWEDCAQEEMSIFLDSSLPGEMGRYSILGRHSYLNFYEKDGLCFQDGQVLNLPMEQALAQYLRANYEEHTTDLPLVSGALGYFSYDYGRKFEKIRSRHKAKVDMPDAWFVFYDNLIIEDCQEKVLYVTARGMLLDQEQSCCELEEWVAALSKHKGKEAPPKQEKLAPFSANFTKEAYQKAISDMIQYIVEGDIYIANMTQQLEIASGKRPQEVFRYLRHHNPSPFGAYLNFPDFQVVCASPERFLYMKDGVVETRPIKGTRKRGDTPREDAALKKELEESEKDRSELLMIVDLERNDLNHVCQPGSVQVTEHFAVQTYATVFHLVTTIVGRLRDGLSAIDLIPAAFPGGSITGAPKIRAMEIIDELERDRRGLYTGSIGYVSLDGSCDLNIVIRTAVYQNGVYHLGVGGGITCESETEFEYEETLQKAKAVREAIYEGDI